jgi:hypothetical protein
MPPPLTDDQISDALDGLADADVHAHLDSCPACAARLVEARRLEVRLHADLRRWDCPPPQLLADYHLGRVDAEQDRALIRHLTGCASCRAEVEELRMFLLDDEPQPGAVPTFATRQPAAPAPQRRTALGPLIASLLPRAAASVLRGAAPTSVQAEAGDATILLDIQSSGGQAIVQGQVVAEDQERWTGALIELRQSGALRATAPVDDLGTFTLGPLPIAIVELRLSPPGGRMVVIPDVDLGG